MSEAPSQQRIAFAIELVHKARRKLWPPAEIFHEADIEPMKKLAWLAQWHKAREGWRDHVETVVEQLALAKSVEELDETVRVTYDALQESAAEFQEAMAKLLDPDKPQDDEGE